MRAQLKTLGNLIATPAIIIPATLGLSILLTGATGFFLANRGISIRHACVATAATAVLITLVGTGARTIYMQNQALKRSAYLLHEINHLYRDALSRLFSIYESARSQKKSLATEQSLQFEQYVLSEVCRRIASIFWELISRRCVVTVKLLFTKDGKSHCFTWARSDQSPSREAEPADGFAVKTGENIAFDTALALRPSATSYFFSPDLIRDARLQRYTNQREGWQRLYRSAIVVPIRHVINRELREIDAVGFLCLDTRSTFRLNNSYHVEFLAAFADQMYNFMSLLRRTYVLPRESEGETDSATEDVGHDPNETSPSGGV